MVSRDGHTVRHLVDDVELLDGDLIDFVQHVDAGDVDPALTGDSEWLLHTQVIATDFAAVCYNR